MSAGVQGVGDRAQAAGAMYLGDLDPAGVRILMGVKARRKAEERPTLQPHRGLYGWLLENGCRRPLEKAPADELVRSLRDAFPADLANALVELWSEGQRIPQESFGLEQLRGKEAAIATPAPKQADAAQDHQRALPHDGP